MLRKVPKIVTNTAFFFTIHLQIVEPRESRVLKGPLWSQNHNLEFFQRQKRKKSKINHLDV